MTSTASIVRDVPDIASRIRDELQAGPRTRADLVAALELPRTTIYDVLKRLIAQHEVTTAVIRVPGVRGRPRVAFQLGE